MYTYEAIFDFTKYNDLFIVLLPGGTGRMLPFYVPVYAGNRNFFTSYPATASFGEGTVCGGISVMGGTRVTVYEAFYNGNNVTTTSVLEIFVR